MEEKIGETGEKAKRLKENCISWKAILKYIAEFPEDDWFTVNEFHRLYGISRVRIQQQLSTFRTWGYVRRKRKARVEGVKFRRQYLYQITPAGRNRMEFIIKQAERDALFFCAQKQAGG